jgi:acyl-CoA reductase-like NAD-dependent aldehyde dehydrogenase
MKHRLWINGKLEDSKTVTPVLAPFNQEKVGEVCQADAAQMETALAASDAAFHAFRKSSAFTRSRLLAAMAQGIGNRRKEFVERIVLEAGKPKLLSDIEVSRAISTFTIASEEAKRFGGELIPLDLDAGGRAFSPAMSDWVPRGPVLAIGPFNFPLNLLAHKIAPALAVGASVIVKPPPQAPGAASLLAEVFAEAAKSVSDAREIVPLALLQVVNGPNDVIGKAVTDPRIGILSFTGSDVVGWMLQQKAVKKKICLELGGNAAVIVHSDADIERAAQRCAFGGFAYAGQICISVQRIYVQDSVMAHFRESFLKEVAKLKVGDPSKDDTVVGPLIDSANAERVLSWIDAAKKGGAKVLQGGTREGNVIAPTVIADAKDSDRVNCDEIFGPVVTLATYSKIDEAIADVNRSRFGLQAGIFSDSAKVIRKACNELEVGGIIVNEIPTYRADHMPYGGMKDSGLGREGLRYAMEDFCERRTVVTWVG